MSEGNEQRNLASEFVPLQFDVSIDEFEKLYAISSAKLNASSMLDDGAYNPDEFDEICNYAQFKLNHPELFRRDTRIVNQNDTHFYMIPIHIKMFGQNVKCNSLIDANGYGLYVVLQDGKVIPAAEMLELTGIGPLSKAGALTDAEVKELLKSEQSVDEIAKLIANGELDLEEIRYKAFVLVRAKGLDPEAIIKDARERDLPQDEQQKAEEEELADKSEEKEEEELSPEEERRLEEDAKEEAERIGIGFDVLEQIARQKGCKVHQIRYRELYRQDLIKERIGKDFDRYRGKLGIARITYGFREEMVVIDKTTGSILIDNRKVDHELEDLVPRWPHGTRMPIKKDEARSYISYIDENGNPKKTKYLNNGKYIDMAKDERERFIVEVAAITKELSEAIKAYEKANTMENWQKVRSAMAKRVALDRKYNVLRNQKAVTHRTLESTLEETLGEVGAPSRIRKRTEDVLGDDIEDPRLRSRHRDPRWE